jgi:hypothetical protein
MSALSPPSLGDISSSLLARARNRDTAAGVQLVLWIGSFILRCAAARGKGKRKENAVQIGPGRCNPGNRGAECRYRFATVAAGRRRASKRRLSAWRA